MKAFYFSKQDKKLRYNDGRKIVVGETHTVDCTPEVCKIGLHASVKLLDALRNAPGSILYLVEMGGYIDKGPGKISATKRTYLAEFDAKEVLREYARVQASYNIHLVEPYCTEEQYETIIHFLKTGNNSADAAAYAACACAAYAAADAADAFDADYAAAYATAAAADSLAAAAEAAVYATDADDAAACAAYAADYADAVYNKIPDQNETLTNMIREATGWDI